MISGIAFAVITGFRRLASNSVVSEMLKHLPNNNLQVSGNCWRNTLQHEIDYLETEGKELRAWEITFNPNARFRVTPLFEATYSVKPGLIRRELAVRPISASSPARHRPGKGANRR